MSTKTVKRLLTLVLMLSMVLGMIPTGFAADADDASSVKWEKIGETVAEREGVEKTAGGGVTLF